MRATANQSDMVLCCTKADGPWTLRATQHHVDVIRCCACTAVIPMPRECNTKPSLQCHVLGLRQLRRITISSDVRVPDAIVRENVSSKAKKHKKSRFLDLKKTLKNVKKRNSNIMYCRPKVLGLNIPHSVTQLRPYYIINIVYIVF